MPKAFGKEIIRKSRKIRYFTRRRIQLEYKPLAKPVTEYTAWFREPGCQCDHGYLVSESTYRRLKVPETIHDSEADRLAWEAAQAKARRGANSGFLYP